MSEASSAIESMWEFPAGGSAKTPSLGDHEIRDCLSEGATFLAVAPGGRCVTLKILEPDLISRGQLHPSVRDRLARVREIAHSGIANLHGVERDAGSVYAIWEYVDGIPLKDWPHAATRSAREVLLLARELVLALEALHARGLVHGAIHSRNVIVGPANQLKLTHLSPYLYTDVAVDIVALLEVLHAVARDCALQESPLLRVIPALDDGSVTECTLRLIGTHVASALEARQVPAPVEKEIAFDRRRRGWSAVSAVTVAILGVWLAYSTRRYLGGLITAVPSPPEAPRAALQP